VVFAAVSNFKDAAGSIVQGRMFSHHRPMLCMKIHRNLGLGFKGAVYKDALGIELQNTGIPYEREKSFNLRWEMKT
jgi:GxxExxY protein